MVTDVVVESGRSQAVLLLRSCGTGRQAPYVSPIFIVEYMVLVMVPADVSVRCA